MNFNKMVLELYLNEKTNQREFSNKYNINYSYLNHVLNNHQECKFEFLYKLATNMGKKINIEIL
jgi:hypothetical protein